MLDCDVKNGWIQFLEFIENRCSSAEYENWIAPIHLVEARIDLIILDVPNPFVQEYLLDNFKEVLCNFLPLHASGEPAIQFIISTDKAVSTPAADSVEEAPPPPQQLSLNHLYTFDNFVEGPSNQFVKSAAVGVANRPGKSYNPLFKDGGDAL